MKAGKIIKKQSEAKKQATDASIKAAVEAVKTTGIGSFMLMAWEGGDPSSGRATVHTEEMKAGGALNLALVAVDIHVGNLMQGAGEDAKKALDEFRVGIKAELQALDRALAAGPRR